MDAATAGQTINVKAGTYEENLTVSKAVTIQGAGATTIIKGSITINGAGAAVKNLTLQPSSGYAVNINKTGSGTSTIEGVTFDLGESASGGIQINGSYNRVVLSGNTFKGVAAPAVFFKSLTESTITFGDGTEDNNILGDGFDYQANTDITATSAKNTFYPGASYKAGIVTVELPVSIAFIGETGYPTVQKAVDAAKAGETVAVNEGVFDEDITISKKITLQGSEEGSGTTLNSVTISGAAATVKNLTVKPSTTAFGVSIAQSGKGATVDNVVFTLSKSGVTGVTIGAKGSGTTADVVKACIFDCQGNVAIEATSAIATLRANEIDHPASNYGIRISGSGNTITLARNTFTEAGAVAVNFHNMTKSTITFGDGSNDDNSTDGAEYYNGTGTSLTAEDNTFKPEAYFDTDNDGILTWGKKLVLTYVVDRVWGLYSRSGSAWNESAFGGTADTDRSIAMDGEYIYLPETIADKQIWAISMADHSAFTLPVGTVKEEGYCYLSCARMIDGVLAVSNIVNGGLYPTLYMYNNGIDADPDVMELETADNTVPNRLGDTFSFYGTTSSGWLTMAYGSKMHVWKMNKGSLSKWGYYTFSGFSGVTTYNPYPADVNNGVITSRTDGAAGAKTSPKFSSLDPDGTLSVSSSSSGAVAVQFFEFNDQRFVAYATQEDDEKGYLNIKRGDLSTNWVTILNSGTAVGSPLAIHASNNTGSSAHNAMDVAVYDDGSGIYIACLKQGVGLSLFKLTMDYR